MITDEEFDVQMHDLFHQLADRIATGGDPLTILEHRPDTVPAGTHDPAPIDVRGRRRIAMVAAMSLVGLGVAAMLTREGSVHRVAPVVSTGGVDPSVAATETVEQTVAESTPPQAAPLATEQSTTTSLPIPPDPYGQIATMLDTAQGLSYQAMVKAITRCMLDQGYTYESVPDPWIGMTDVLTTHAWNSPSTERASTHGYLVPGQNEPVVNPDGDTAFGGPDYQHALYGDVIRNWELPTGENVPPGFGVSGPVMDGCRPTAQTQIAGGGDPGKAFRISDYFVHMQNIRNEALVEMAANTDYQTAVTAWATCMHAHGYDYTNLDEPRRAAFPNPRPGAAEVATATQDAGCKSDVGITELGDRLFNDLTAQWFAQHPTEYSAIAEYLAGIMDRANTELAS